MRYFILVALILYILPNIFIIYGLIKLPVSKFVKIPAILLLLFLVFAFPVGEGIYNTTHSTFAKLYLQLGFYYLPFLLYFVLTSIAYHIILILAHWFHVLSKEITSSKTFRCVAYAVLLIISITIVMLGHHNFNNIRISNYQIDVPARSSRLDQLKIVMAADLHIHEMTSKKFMEEFVEKINFLEPDIVLLPGDIIEGAGETSDLSFFSKKLSHINSMYGVYAASGNHEHYGRTEEATRFFKDAGIIMVDDTVICIDQAFQVGGLADISRENKQVKQYVFSSFTDTLPSILLHHRPDNLDFANRANVDIQLSGHTHNGQLWPLNMITNTMYAFNWGYEIFNNTHVFVTCGVQGWGPPVRTGSYSEIMEIDVMLH